MGLKWHAMFERAALFWVERHPNQHRFVVGAQFVGFAMLGDGQAQVPQHGSTAASGEHLQAQGQA